MKKILFAFALLLVTVLTFASCGGGDKPSGNDAPVHTHSFAEWDLTKKPTCTEDGLKVRYCSCGEKQSEVVVSLGHTPAEAVVEDRVEPTYEEDGSYNLVVRCTTCNEKLSESSHTIPMLKHTPASEVTENYIAATCYAEGSYDSVVYCSDCGAELVRTKHIVDKIAHSPAAAVEENIVDSTCYSVGSKDMVVYCSIPECHAFIEKSSVTIDKKAHTPASAVEENRVNPTYEKDGSYQLVIYCSVTACHEELERTTHTLDMLVHHPGSVVVENEVKATCTNTGSYDEVVYCLDADCGHKELSRKTITTDMIPHTSGSAVEENRTDATCYAEGSYDSVAYCAVCGTELSRATVTLQKIAHTPANAVVENRVEASCTTDGSYDEVVYCSVENCKVQISRANKILAATGHAATEWIIDKNAEETESGSKHQICLICKATIKTETIPPLKPNIAEGSRWKINYYGVLTIKYTYSTVGANEPWAEYKDRITEIDFSGSSGIKIGESAFENYPNLRKVDFADKVGTIGNYAFYNCPNLKSAFIYDMIVGQYAFANCQSLQWVAFEWSTYSLKIKDYAFSNCTSLKNIYIYGSNYMYNESSIVATSFSSVTANVNYPKGITISDSVKNNYGGTLTWVETTSGVCGPDAYWNIEDNKLTVSGTGSIVSLHSGSCYPWYPSSDSITSIEIQDGITYIPSYTFEYMESAETVTLPNTITILNCNAFNDCRSLNNLHIPKSITLIQNNFNRCNVLSTFYYEGTKEEWLSIDGISNVYEWESCPRVVHFTKEKNSEDLKYTLSPDGTYYIVSCAGTFSGTTLQIPSMYNGKPVKEIGAYGFYDSKNLISVIIPNTIVSIGSYAFTNCDNLNSVEIPDSVTTIGKYAFQDCDGLIEMIIPGSVTSIDDNVFERCSNLASVTIQKGVTAINYGAFKYCSSLANIVISDTVTNIGSYAFSGCTSLTSIVIPDSVTSIGDYTFYCCSSLTSIVIPNSVTTIGRYAFYNCLKLTNIVLPDDATTIGRGAFDETGYYKSNWENGLLYISNCLYEASETVSGTVVVKTGTISIASSAFVNCNKITGIVFPDTLTTICSEAFNCCNYLTTVVIPSSVTHIGYRAFSYCDKLTNVYYGGSDAQWSNIEMHSDNSTLKSATIHYAAIDEFYTVTNDSSFPWSFNVSGELVSTNKTDSSTSSYTITAKKDFTISFSYKTSSESDCDELVIIKNGITLVTKSGSTAYVYCTVNLSAGDILVFQYSKDSSSYKYNDCAYIKNLSVVQ